MKKKPAKPSVAAAWNREQQYGILMALKEAAEKVQLDINGLTPPEGYRTIKEESELRYRRSRIRLYGRLFKDFAKQFKVKVCKACGWFDPFHHEDCSGNVLKVKFK